MNRLGVIVQEEVCVFVCVCVVKYGISFADVEKLRGHSY